MLKPKSNLIVYISDICHTNPIGCVYPYIGDVLVFWR